MHSGGFGLPPPNRVMNDYNYQDKVQTTKASGSWKTLWNDPVFKRFVRTYMTQMRLRSLDVQAKGEIVRAWQQGPGTKQFAGYLSKLDALEQQGGGNLPDAVKGQVQTRLAGDFGILRTGGKARTIERGVFLEREEYSPAEKRARIKAGLSVVGKPTGRLNLRRTEANASEERQWIKEGRLQAGQDLKEAKFKFRQEVWGDRKTQVKREQDRRAIETWIRLNKEAVAAADTDKKRAARAKFEEYAEANQNDIDLLEEMSRFVSRVASGQITPSAALTMAKAAKKNKIKRREREFTRNDYERWRSNLDALVKKYPGDPDVQNIVTEGRERRLSYDDIAGTVASLVQEKEQARKDEDAATAQVQGIGVAQVNAAWANLLNSTPAWTDRDREEQKARVELLIQQGIPMDEIADDLESIRWLWEMKDTLEEDPSLRPQYEAVKTAMMNKGWETPMPMY